MAGDYDIGAAFAAIEDELIASMLRNMERHRAEEGTMGMQWGMWQSEQLRALERYRRENRRKFSSQFREINGKIGELIKAARIEGNMDQEISILEAITKGFSASKITSGSTAEFFRVNDRKLDALIRATTNDVQKAETAILRMADDQYRKIIYNAQVYANTGAGTYEKAVDMATKDMLSSGLNCVEYKNGARHTLSDYASMAIRTASKRAYLTGEGEKRREWGISTVIVNKRGNPCPKCLPFCGKVFIDDVWSGGKKTDGKYPLMSAAVAAGLYHPNCRDSHTTYFEGISTPPDDNFTKEEIAGIEKRSKETAKKQYAKRQEERFDRMARHSSDSDNKKRYENKAKQWNTIAKQSDSGIIKENKNRLKLDLQLFAEKDIKRQESNSLKRAIKKYQKQILEHGQKINNPEEFYKDWASYDPRYQKGLKRHWEKEIDNFRQSINDRVKELQKRGDYDE